MNDNIIMENIYFNTLLKRSDVSVQLDDIYKIDNDIKEEGSGILPIQCKTEESKLLIIQFLKENNKYFSDRDDMIMLLLEEHDVKSLSQCHVEIKDEDTKVEDNKDESDDEDNKDESDDEDNKDESDEDVESDDEDNKDESDEDIKCGDGCNCINCTTINYDTCNVKCKCVNCVNLNH